MLHEEAVDVMPSYLCLQVLLEDFSNGSGYKLLYDYLLRLDRFATMQLASAYMYLCILVLYIVYFTTVLLILCVFVQYSGTIYNLGIKLQTSTEFCYLDAQFHVHTFVHVL